MTSGPRIITNGLKIYIDPANSKNDLMVRLGREIQTQNINLDETMDSSKSTKTASLGANSKISFDSLSITNDWSVSIFFRTNLNTKSIGFNQTLFGNDSNSPGIIEINSENNQDFVSTYISISYENNMNQLKLYKSYVTPFDDMFVKSVMQDSYWLNNSIMLVITFEKLTTNSGVYKVYIDGELKDFKKINDIDASNTFKINQIGGQGNLNALSQKPLSGDIFLCSVYEKLLNDEDVMELFNVFKSRINK